MDVKALIEPVKQLSVEAGKKILAIYETDFDVEHKADESPLTAADMASHKAIVAGLEALTPDVPILSEESTKIPYAERKQWDWYWLVDPLDGTKEFIKKNGEFTVNIALIHNGDAVMGIVHVPVKNMTYFGATGHGAFKEEAGNAPVSIKVAGPNSGTLKIVGSRSHAGDSLKAFLDKVGDHEMVSMGSSLKLCLVADGTADIYPRLGLTSEWDTAAAQAVVEAAGGKVTKLDMEPLKYNTKDELLNPFFLVFGDSSRDWSQYLD